MTVLSIVLWLFQSLNVLCKNRVCYARCRLEFLALALHGLGCITKYKPLVYEKGGAQDYALKLVVCNSAPRGQPKVQADDRGQLRMESFDNFMRQPY